MKLPDHRDLMLLEESSNPFSDDAWAFEPKLDGYRAIAIVEEEKVRLLSRWGKTLAVSFPEVVDALRARVPAHSVLDAELVVCDAQGRPDFGLLQKRARYSRPITVADGVKRHPARLYVFDALVLGGQDLRNLPYADRKAELEAALAECPPPLYYLTHVDGEGQWLYDYTNELKLEGIVAKRLDSPYRAGRTRAWLKIKHAHARDAAGSRRGVRWH